MNYIEIEYFNNLNFTAMKKITILAISLLMFTTSQAIDKDKKKSKTPVVVKIIPQGSNDGIKMYAVILSNGKTYDYMYMSEIKQAKRTGIWKYDEMLEYNKH